MKNDKTRGATAVRFDCGKQTENGVSTFKYCAGCHRSVGCSLCFPRTKKCCVAHQPAGFPRLFHQMLGKRPRLRNTLLMCANSPCGSNGSARGANACLTDTPAGKRW